MPKVVGFSGGHTGQNRTLGRGRPMGRPGLLPTGMDLSAVQAPSLFLG